METRSNSTKRMEMVKQEEERMKIRNEISEEEKKNIDDISAMAQIFLLYLEFIEFQLGEDITTQYIESIIKNNTSVEYRNLMKDLVADQLLETVYQGFSNRMYPKLDLSAPISEEKLKKIRTFLKIDFEEAGKALRIKPTGRVNIHVLHKMLECLEKADSHDQLPTAQELERLERNKNRTVSSIRRSLIDVGLIQCEGLLI